MMIKKTMLLLILTVVQGSIGSQSLSLKLSEIIEEGQRKVAECNTQREIEIQELIKKIKEELQKAKNREECLELLRVSEASKRLINQRYDKLTKEEKNKTNDNIRNAIGLPKSEY